MFKKTKEGSNKYFVHSFNKSTYVMRILIISKKCNHNIVFIEQLGIKLDCMGQGLAVFPPRSSHFFIKP